jgi:hypothetical protein
VRWKRKYRKLLGNFREVVLILNGQNDRADAVAHLVKDGWDKESADSIINFAGDLLWRLNNKFECCKGNMDKTYPGIGW